MPMEPATSSSGVRRQQRRPPETEEEETGAQPGILGEGPRGDTELTSSFKQKQEERATRVGEPVQFERPQGDIIWES